MNGCDEKSPLVPYTEECPLLLKRFYEECKECELSLHSVLYKDTVIKSWTISRLGLACAGWLGDFTRENIQVIGLAEWSYLRSLSYRKRIATLQNICKTEIPALVFCDNLKPEKVLLACAEKWDVTIFSTQLGTDFFCDTAQRWLKKHLSPTTSIHGTLMNIFGAGLLLTGKSGIGKSECALDLICKGHILISDDVVHIRQEDNRLIGESNQVLGHHMEIRGIGIVDIKEFFGLRCIGTSKYIDAIVDLVEWNKSEYFERVGLQEKTVSILDAKIPHYKIPVSQGKTVSSILEILALKLHSQNKGKTTVKNLNKKLISAMKNSSVSHV